VGAVRVRCQEPSEGANRSASAADKRRLRADGSESVRCRYLSSLPYPPLPISGFCGETPRANAQERPLVVSCSLAWLTSRPNGARHLRRLWFPKVDGDGVGWRDDL
jgi:hypothetical protein